MFTHKNIDQHLAVFQNLVARSDNYLMEGNHHAAAAYAEIAATYAEHHHTGLFGSYQLERILLAIGSKIANKTYTQDSDARLASNPRHVLHVITEAVGIGGHTRMVWRWIQQDTEGRHSVVLTRQHQKIPRELIDAVKHSGGKIYRLNDSLGDILTWSQDLRRIAQSTDFVVMHIYNHDVIPLIAFSDKRNLPPILLLNQSDHKFWVGASISDIVVNQRYSGARLNQARRGIDESRCGLLPIVLPTISRKVSVSDAKAQIGLSQDTILLLSIARHTKYAPLSGYGSKFNDLLLPDSILLVLQKYPNSELIVIGPDFTNRWEQASQTVQGRISALGRREDTALFYQAADIFLDSFPFGSNTSCLEAGSYALPLVSCNPYSDISDVLCADTPALDKSILRVKNQSEFISVVSHLIEDPEYRTRIGKETQNSIMSVHTGDNWKQYLHNLYLQAANTSSTIVIDNEEDQKPINELDILLLDIEGVRDDRNDIHQDLIRLLPLDLRVDHWLQLFKERQIFKPSLLLSEWMAVQLKKTRDRVRIPTK